MNEARKIRVVINGAPREVAAAPNDTLSDLLRYRLELPGTKKGCETGDCGACTVIMDGKAVNSCLVLALEADGAQITTIEGLGSAGQLHPLQQAFVDHGAVQCGFCVPGMIMAAKALLDEDGAQTEADIKLAISGNLCRCADYTAIMEAIRTAGKAVRVRDR